MKQILFDDLRPGMVLAQDIFVSDTSTAPILAKDTVLSQATIDRLEAHRHFSIFVQDDVDAKMVRIPKSRPVISDDLRDDAIVSISQLFDVVKSEEPENNPNPTSAYQVVKQLDTVVEQLVETLVDDQRALINIRDLKSYDDYTYHHSLSVALLTIAIGQKLGFGHDQLKLAGRCAIMHDIGKTSIPIEIINKSGRLNNEEYHLVQQHSAKGYKYLMNRGIGDEELWTGVLAHHEKIDGTGYPNGLSGEEIPALSRIISVGDVYDALTSQRSYRSPMQPNDAFEYIMAGVGSAFDYDIVMAYLEKLELFPIGSFVELSNGAVAVVIDNEHTLRPLVQNVANGEIYDLLRDRQFLSVTINRLLPQQVILGQG